jgi:hypothetical protein
MKNLKGVSRMVYRPVVKVLTLLLSLSTMIVAVPFTLAESTAATPLGTVVSTGSVTIGKSAAPTGTTVFAGDQVASTQPALINFSSGSRIEMTKAAATFARQGSTLVVQASQGLMRFNFKKGEDVQINAGDFRFTGGASSNRIGELGLNRSGQVVLTLTEGSFAALNTANGARAEVRPSAPLMALNQSGNGSLVKNGKKITDAEKKLQANELKGKCIVSGDEAYQINGNTATVISIKGAWKKETGTYDYIISDCNKEALIGLGASAASASAAATTVVAGSAAAAGAAAGVGGSVAGGTAAAVVAGVAGAAGAGIGINDAVKSPSSR